MVCCCLTAFPLSDHIVADQEELVLTPIDDLRDDDVSFELNPSPTLSPTFDDEEDDIFSNETKVEAMDGLMEETASIRSTTEWSVVPWINKAVSGTQLQDLERTRILDLKSKLLQSMNRTQLNTTLKEGQVRCAVKAVCTVERVDLAFVIDATGSMLRHIKNVKQSIRNIIKKIRHTHSNLRIRLAVVAYRDLSDARPCEVLDFVTSVERFEAFLGTLRAVGGADTPEDMAGGIRQANRLSWSNPTRLVFVVADAPCHGVEFHNFDDNYPYGTPGIAIVDEFRQLLYGKGKGATMALYFGRISNATDKMVLRMRSRYDIHMSVVAFTDVAKITSTVTKAVRTAIFNSMDAATREAKSALGTSDAKSSLWLPDVHCGTYRVQNDQSLVYFDECTDRPVIPVRVFRNNSIQSIRDLKSPLGIGILQFPYSPGGSPSQSTMVLRHDPAPFAQGSSRIAIHGQLARSESELDEIHSAKVLKVFKQTDGDGILDRHQYFLQMEASAVAGYLSSLYNRSRPRHCASIQFLQVCVAEHVDPQLGARQFCVEPPLPTTGSAAFTKYCNNTGFWNVNVVDESLLRFSYFTYQVTKGYLMVVDLQGVRDGQTYYLTDPAILCRDLGRFGSTNLGDKFLSKCLASTRYLLEERGRYSV